MNAPVPATPYDVEAIRKDADGQTAGTVPFAAG